MSDHDATRPEPTFSTSLMEIVLVTLGWMAPLVGLVLLVYSFDGYRTLSNTQALGCLLVSIPFGIVVAGTVWRGS